MASFEISGTRVEYVEQGRGEPVLLLHSSGGSSAQWRSLTERLGDRYRVMAPDLYGYGATGPWRGHGAFRLEHEAEIVHVLLGRLGGSAHLVGHSYGGAVALHVARKHSGLLRSLTVIEPVAFHLLRESDDGAFEEISSVADGVAASLARGDTEGGFGRFVDYWSGPGAWEGIPAAKREAMARGLAKVALDFQATLNEPARLEDFNDLALPTLVVQAACSPLPTRRICERLAAALPEARVATIEGAGHMCPLTHREQVNGLIEANLSRRQSCKPYSQARRATVTPSASRYRSGSAGTSIATF